MQVFDLQQAVINKLIEIPGLAFLMILCFIITRLCLEHIESEEGNVDCSGRN